MSALDGADVEVSAAFQRSAVGLQAAVNSMLQPNNNAVSLFLHCGIISQIMSRVFK